MSDEKKVKQKYLCFRHPEIGLVMSPERKKESVSGHIEKIPGRRIQFKRNLQGVGEYSATTQEEMDVIENSEFYGRFIKKAEGIDMGEFKVVRNGPEVIQGTLGSEATVKPGTPAPADVPKAEKKASISKGLKRGPKPKEQAAA